MANSLNSITTTYAGEFAGKYIAAALLEGNTISQGGITVKPNIAFKETMKKAVVSNVLADGTCDFTKVDNAITLTERVLQPKELQVNLELCKKDFVSDWESKEMGYSAYKNLPPKFSDFLIGHVAGQVAQSIESYIWGGDGTQNGQFDGITTLAAADADVIDVAGVAVNASNVIDKIGAVHDAIPSAVKSQADTKIYVSSNVFYAYIRALGGFQSGGQGANGVDSKGTLWYNDGNLKFDGIDLFLANGLADNKMVAAQTSNLFFGTGLFNDTNIVKTIDMADIDGSQNVRMIMRMTAGVQYGLGSEIVYYTV